ncbi:MAG: LamG domain-containing protein, partial [Chloroflexales bacterium]|nr:LamG domain-containing protein [Chloroflexales bacterium]
MTVQPTYHWQFEEGEGSVAKDRVEGVQGTLRRVLWEEHGRIGNAIRLRGNGAYVNFGNVVGQFGTSDFTVAFGMKFIDRHGENDLDIIGNRTTSGHGNWFSLRQERAKITFEVDENGKGKNYAVAKTNDLSVLKQRKWHHIAVVREGRTLKIYIDGELAAQGASTTGVANIQNGAALKLGDTRRGTAVSRYEDLRIYHTALNAIQVQNLAPSVNRLLRAGELELVAIDDAAVILTQDVEDLSRYSKQFQKLRLGPNTGATLYQKTNFGGVAQKLYAGIPEIRFTRLGAFPRSIHIWSPAGEPFTGKWIIKAPNGQYLSRSGASLTTAPHRLLDELFVFHYNLNHDQPQLIPVTDQKGLLLKVDDEPAVLLVDDSESHKDAFSIVNTSHDQWLQLNQDTTLSWTQQHEDRSVFFRVVKMADNEGQVGELSPGEVALYEHRAYWGKTWILSDSEHDVAGNYTSLQSFHGLDNQTSSIRLGPDTGVTLFANENQEVTTAKRETEIEDFVENVPDLKEAQVGDDALSSIKIFRTVAPETVFTSFTTKLSQDYRMVGNNLEEFSAYRTILRFAPGAGEVEVSATDLTTIEVEGTTYEIDEERSVTLGPNAMNRIMITSEADGINTPGLKFRTSDMAENERVVIFPDREVHQQIAELEDDALWNATDAQGNLIVDRQAHSHAEVASIQNTIKKTMATVTYAADAPAAKRSARSRIPSASRAISSAAITNPWILTFEPASVNNDSPSIAARTATLGSASAPNDSPVHARIREEEISHEEFTRLLSQAAQSHETAKGRFASRRGLFARIKEAVKKAVSVVVGFVKDVIHVIVKTAEDIIDFVVDTAEKVGAFVEAVVEKVVTAIKKFVEFLQFLFDWGDILETQRYLVRAINSGFDSAT